MASPVGLLLAEGERTGEPWLFFIFGMACGILLSQPGVEPASPALDVWSLNHWTTREVPRPTVLHPIVGYANFFEAGLQTQ